MLSLVGQLGSYELLLQKGPKGKFGNVWFGKRLGDNLAVTAKKLSPNASTVDREARKAIMAVSHPNLAKSLEIIDCDGECYLIREYVEGTSLKTIAEKYNLHRHLAPSFYVDVAIHLLGGLSVLHVKSLVHRDIKPSNIIIKHLPKASPKTWRPSDVVLIDFEQACLIPVETKTRAPFSMVYSPPEQLLNHNYLVNPSSDLFALSVTLYELMSGRAPWVDCNAEILLNLQLTYPMKKPRHVDDALFAIMAKAGYKEPFPLPPRRLAAQVVAEILSKGVQKRLSSADEFRAQLEAYMRTAPKLERSTWFERFMWG